MEILEHKTGKYFDVHPENPKETEFLNIMKRQDTEKKLIKKPGYLDPLIEVYRFYYCKENNKNLILRLEIVADELEDMKLLPMKATIIEAIKILEKR